MAVGNQPAEMPAVNTGRRAEYSKPCYSRDFDGNRWDSHGLAQAKRSLALGLLKSWLSSGDANGVGKNVNRGFDKSEISRISDSTVLSKLELAVNSAGGVHKLLPLLWFYLVASFVIQQNGSHALYAEASMLLKKGKNL